MTNRTENDSTIIEHLASKATQRAARVARMGQGDRGVSAQLGTLGQMQMRIEHPSTVSPASREGIISDLRGRGFTVRENFNVTTQGRATFFSLTVEAPSAE